MKQTQTLFKTLCMIGLTLFLLSCEKVNEENYNKIKEGMTLGEVKALLGEPTESKTQGGSVPLLGNLSGTKAIWKSKDGKTSVDIVFLNEKVKIKTYNGK